MGCWERWGVRPFAMALPFQERPHHPSDPGRAPKASAKGGGQVGGIDAKPEIHICRQCNQAFVTLPMSHFKRGN